MEFIREYYISIIIVVIFIIGLAILYKCGKKKFVKRTILRLVIQAEKTFGGGTGPLKYESVINMFYGKLPIAVRCLFRPKDIDICIEEAVVKLEELLKSDNSLI